MPDDSTTTPTTAGTGLTVFFGVSAIILLAGTITGFFLWRKERKKNIGANTPPPPLATTPNPPANPAGGSMPPVQNPTGGTVESRPTATGRT